MKKILTALFVCLLLSSTAFAQIPSPFGTCPGINLAVYRTGGNAAINNPVNFYNVAVATGALTQIPGGPLKDPQNAAFNLQINGIGVNKADGLVYGIYSGNVNVLPDAGGNIIVSPRFFRAGSNYAVQDLGNLTAPALRAGENFSVVNSGAGDMDAAGNFYFTAAAGTYTPGRPSPTFTITRLVFGKIAVGPLSANPGTALSPTYVDVNISGANCGNYINTFLNTPYTAAEFINTGLRDLVYDKASNSFYTYVSYEDKSSGSPVWSGQLLKISQSGVLTCYPPASAVPFNASIETAGEMMDAYGNILVLLTDGSIYKVDYNKTTNTFPGTFTLFAAPATTGAGGPIRADMASCGVAPSVLGSCPGIDIAVYRDGNNSATTNPVNLYNVSPATGGMSLVAGGPYKDPLNGTSNLQINGVGVNQTDNLAYGIYSGLQLPAYSGGVFSISPRFFRMGGNYVVQDLGNLQAPPTVAGENFSIVNTAAGEFDKSGNFYFTAATGTTNMSFTSGTINRLLLGTISAASLAENGGGVITPAYTVIDISGANCSGYTGTFMSGPVNPASLTNTGFRDLAYNSANDKFYAYVSYETGTGWNGQMLSLDKAGKLGCLPPVDKSSLFNANTEVTGELLDKNGNMLILLTNGATYKAGYDAATQSFTGDIIPINTGSASPVLRGDMASCGGFVVLPVKLVSFEARRTEGAVELKWASAAEVAAGRFVIERSLDGNNWISVGNVAATNNPAGSRYDYADYSAPSSGVFYRLKMVDADGTVAYSKAVFVNKPDGEASDKLLLLPNPLVSGSVKIILPYAAGTNAVMEVFDQTGKQIIKKSIPAQQVVYINTTELKAQGIYEIKVSDGTKIMTSRLVVLK